VRTTLLLRAARITVTAAVAVAVLGAAACDSTPTATPDPRSAGPTATIASTMVLGVPPVPATVRDAAPVTAAAPAPAAKSTTAPPKPTTKASTPPTTIAAPTEGLRFPGTQPFIAFLSYDKAEGWVEFRVATRHKNPDIQDHYAVDPADTGVHRLKLAPDAQVEGVSGLCGAIQGPCTPDQITPAPGLPVPAQIVVDADNRITKMFEQMGVVT
jgi:hypothetical protein